MAPLSAIPDGTRRSTCYEQPAKKLSKAAKKAQKVASSPSSEQVNFEAVDPHHFDSDAVISTVRLDAKFYQPIVDEQALVAHHLDFCNNNAEEAAGVTGKHGRSEGGQQHPLQRAFFLVAQAPSMTTDDTPFLERGCTLFFTGQDGHLRQNSLDLEVAGQYAQANLEWYAICTSGKKGKASGSRVQTATATFGSAMAFLEFVEHREAQVDEMVRKFCDARKGAGVRQGPAVTGEHVIQPADVPTSAPVEQALGAEEDAFWASFETERVESKKQQASIATEDTPLCSLEDKPDGEGQFPASDTLDLLSEFDTPSCTSGEMTSSGTLTTEATEPEDVRAPSAQTEVTKTKELPRFVHEARMLLLASLFCLYMALILVAFAAVRYATYGFRIREE